MSSTPDSLQRFTRHLRSALTRSIELAIELKSPTIHPLFVVYSLVEESGSIGSEILQNSNVTVDSIREYLHSDIVLPSDMLHGSKAKLLPLFSEELKHALEHAAVLALQFGHSYIGTEHVLLSVLEEHNEVVEAVLAVNEADISEMQKQLYTILTSTTKLTSLKSMLNQPPSNTAGPGAPGSGPGAGSGAQPPHQLPLSMTFQHSSSRTPALDAFGMDLTADEAAQRLDPVIGRQEEIDRAIHILARRRKNNPLLIGEPGVGKTAIVEGLAKRIHAGDVPDFLQQKRIVALDLSLIVAGSMYRGEFESRLRQIVDEMRDNPDIILFIDEVHTLVGAGGVQGGNMDAANILKPALAKGDIRMIGATTADEYRKYIENDPALERRFQTVRVDEPSRADSIAILKGLRKYYEHFHGVRFENEAMAAAVDYAIRFIPDRFLPDKAIDLLDEAAAKARIGVALPPAVKRLNESERALRGLIAQKNAAVQEERFEEARALKEQADALAVAMKTDEALVEGLQPEALPINGHDIAQVVAGMTGMPVEHIESAGLSSLTDLGDRLRKRILGQDHAVERVVGALKRSTTGLSSPERPMGTFLFLGPSGVGKTELAQSLARDHFGDADALIRVDMSEFSEGFTVSKLIGAPAGYIGHDNSPKFAEAIRRKPYAVVLFDELEKAHPDVFNVMLQILENGRLTDSHGRELNFRNSIIVLTSNIGIDMLTKQAALGFGDGSGSESTAMSASEIESVITGELKSYLPQEFLNRIDHHIVFQPLDERVVRRIVTLELAPLQKRLRTKGVKLSLRPAARKWLAQQGFSPDSGARGIRQVVARHIEEPIADLLLSGDASSGNAVVVDMQTDAEGAEALHMHIE